LHKIVSFVWYSILQKENVVKQMPNNYTNTLAWLR